MLDVFNMAAAFGDHASLLLAKLNFGGLTGEGDNNVMSLVQTVFVWAVILWMIIALVTRQFRQAISVLIIGGIVGVFVYAPDQIQALGDGILSFFGIKA